MIGTINITMNSNYREVNNLKFKMSMLLTNDSKQTGGVGPYSIKPPPPGLPKSSINSSLSPTPSAPPSNLLTLSTSSASRYEPEIYFPLTILLNNKVYNVTNKNLTLLERKEFWSKRKIVDDFIFDTENSPSYKKISLADAEILDIPKYNIDFVLSEIFRTKTLLNINNNIFIVNSFKIIRIDNQATKYNVNVNLNLIERNIESGQTITTQVRVENCEERGTLIKDILYNLLFKKPPQTRLKRIKSGGRKSRKNKHKSGFNKKRKSKTTTRKY
jgi:hypothetical protein